MSPTRLEPVYLANVLLFFTREEDALTFIAVSHRCLVATQMVRINPVLKCKHKFLHLPVINPHRTLLLFPNIQTLQVRTLDALLNITIPQTVSRIIITDSLAENDDVNVARLRMRGVLAQIVWVPTLDKTFPNLVFFTRLQRACIKDPSLVHPDTFPRHKLRVLWVNVTNKTASLVASIPNTCAENIVAVCKEPITSFPFPPHVSVVCHQLDSSSSHSTIHLSSQTPFVITARDPLATTNACFLTEASITVDSNTLRRTTDTFDDSADLTCFTTLTSVKSPSACVSLMLPPSVVKLSLACSPLPPQTNLTSLELRNCNNVSLAPFTCLASLSLDNTLVESLEHHTNLTALTLTSSKRLERNQHYPTTLRRLKIDATQVWPFECVVGLSFLTALTFILDKNGSFDFSMPQLRRLSLHKTIAPCLPPSLTSLTMMFLQTTDLSMLTHLVKLDATIEASSVGVCFPKQLETLILRQRLPTPFDVRAVDLVCLSFDRIKFVSDEAFAQKLPPSLRYLDVPLDYLYFLDQDLFPGINLSVIN